MVCAGITASRIGLSTLQFTKFKSFNFIREASKMASLPRVFFDMTADDQPVGRIVMEVNFYISACMRYCFLVACFFK